MSDTDTTKKLAEAEENNSEIKLVELICLYKKLSDSRLRNYSFFYYSWYKFRLNTGLSKNL